MKAKRGSWLTPELMITLILLVLLGVAVLFYVLKMK